MKRSATMPHRAAVAAVAAMFMAAGSPLLASGPAPTRAQSLYEIRFMTDMIDHHAMAVHMAEMCLTRAVHPELTATCQSIIDSQSEEIATMQQWLRDWYGVSHEPEMTRARERHMERLASMSAAEFEIHFMKMMIRHHWTAVIKASTCIDRAYHSELVDMCGDMVEAQVAEITQFRTWLCGWYGVCNYGPKGQQTTSIH